MLNMFLIVLTFLALHTPESIAIASLEGVSFNSTNLQNVVVWNPVMEGARYSVEYAIYGDEDKMVRGQLLWRPVKHCTSILLTSCDLSDQTHKCEEAYYARVRAMTDSGVTSNWTVTQRFEPLFHTALGPPHFTVHVSANSLDINLRGPMRWKNKHMKKERSMKNLINDIWYNITVYVNTSRHSRQIITKNQSYRLGSLEYDTMYCISATTYSRFIPLESHRSEWQCEKTPTDPFKRHMLLVILGGLLPSAISLFVLVLALCLVYHYIYGNKQKPPHCTTISPRVENLAPDMSAGAISSSVYKPSLLFVAEEIYKPPPGPWPSIFQPLLALALPQPTEAQEPQLPSCTPPQTTNRASPAYKLQSWQSSGAVSEDHVLLNAEIEEDEDEMPPDYGFVIRSPPEESTGQGNDSGRPPQPPAPPVSGSNHYMMQNNVNPSQSACQSNPDDEDGPTLVDWSPSTGILRIPELSSMPLLELRRKAEEEEDMRMPRSIFSSLVVRQPSQESCEQEDGLLRMETTWQLQVNMDE